MTYLLIKFMKYIGLPLSFIIIYNFFISKSRNLRKHLEGKVVFISGASSGVGEALAHSFHGYGCKVILAARRESELQRVKQDILSKNVNLTTFEPLVVYLDLADVSSINTAIQKTLEVHKNIDILINNGGISCRGDVLNTELDVHTKLMNVNYFGPISLTRAFLPKMVDNRSGNIMFVSSVQGRIAIPDRSAYAASKHACQAYADTLRAEVAKHNVHVSVISPGYINTALSLNALTGAGEQYGVMDASTASGYSPEYVAERIVTMIVNKQPELILAPFSPKIAIVLRCLTPSLYFWIMAKRAK